MTQEPRNLGWIHACLRFFLTPFIRRLKALEGTQDQLRELAERGQILFVSHVASFVDFLIVNELLRRSGQPVLQFTHGMSPFLWLPFKEAFPLWISRCFKKADQVAREEIASKIQAVQEGQNGHVFLKRRRGIFRSRTLYYDGFFGAVAMSSEQRLKPTFLIPTSIFLTRKRKLMKRSMWEIFFGTYDTPSRFRKMIQLFFSSKHGIAILSEHIDLLADMKSQAVEELSQEKIEKRLRWTLLFHLNNEDRAYRGPTKRSRERKVIKILREKRLRTDLEQIAERQNRSMDSVMKEAQQTLHEIASDTSERWVNFLRLLFDWIWARTIEGIDFNPNDFVRLRDLNRQSPVVFLPCHRSHVDYLMFAYMFEKEGMNYPRLAAGDNLSKWPLGWIFRRAGAFFIRRSFKGETIFPVVFEAYVRHLLRERHVVTFFMEGTRSRTGKLLQPKLGLLGMLFDAWQKGVVDDVPLVPVTIDYSRIFEGSAYASEKGGKEKTKENLRSLLQTPKFLKKKHGIVRMRFGSHISLKNFVAQMGFDRNEVGFKNKLPVLQHLALRAMNDINAMVTVTAANVLAGILMGNPKRGMTLNQIKSIFVISVRFLTLRKVELGFVDQKLEVALQNALDTFSQWETIVSVDVGGEKVISVPEDKRIEMEYYKNNALHYILDLVLFATALRCLGGHASVDELEDFIHQLWDIFSIEFIKPQDYPGPEVVARALKAFESIDALELGPPVALSNANPVGHDALQVCAHLLRNFFEAYFTAADVLTSEDFSEGTNRKELLKQISARAELLYAVGTIRCRESLNHVTFSNAVSQFASWHFIQLKNVKGQKYPNIARNEKKLDDFKAFRDQMFTWLQRLD